MHHISRIGYITECTPFHDREIVGVVYCMYARNAEDAWQPWRWCIKPVGCCSEQWELLEQEPRIGYVVRGMR